jgi:hypothetical protein
MLIDKATSAYQYIGTLCDDYIRAQDKVNQAQKKVDALREKGNYKIMGKVVNDDLHKASIKRNTRFRELQTHLDIVAEQES